MRIHERYIKRIAIPVVITGLVALGVNFFVHEKVEEDQSGDYGALVEFGDTDRDFSEAALEEEVQSLENAMASLDEAAQSAPQSDETAQQRARTQEKIEAVASATEENWHALRQEAYSELRAYADLVGSETASPPKANANQ